jgi:hypothetical protein
MVTQARVPMLSVYPSRHLAASWPVRTSSEIHRSIGSIVLASVPAGRQSIGSSTSPPIKRVLDLEPLTKDPREHIYRQHQLPAFCTRCGTTFTHDTELVAHSRLALACDVRVFDPPDGFSKEQERILRRKRKLAGSEESKWRATFKVLFPDDDDEADMPSPCESTSDMHKCAQLLSANTPTADHELGSDMTWESRRSHEFDNYERYLRRELPRLVRQQLEIAASEVSAPLENQLRGQLI